MGTSLAVALGGPFQSIAAPGAGRFRDYCFPEPGWLAGSLAQATAGVRPGGQGQAQPAFARAVYTADPGAAAGPTAYNGVNVMTVISGAAAGQSFALNGLVPRLNPSFIVTDDQAYHRIIFLIAIGNAPSGANTDFGGYIVQTASNTPDLRLMSGGILGWGIQFPSLVAANLKIRGPNGLITLALPITDSTVLHAYEFRILPPTSTQFAQLQLFIDGIPVALPALSSSWAAGTNLPPLALLSGHLAFAVGVINNCLASANLLVQQVRHICAPTFADLF